MIFAFIDVGGPGHVITPADAGWTQLYAHEFAQPGGEPSRKENVALFARCYTAGDGHGEDPDGSLWLFESSGSSAAIYAQLTEWQIT